MVQFKTYRALKSMLLFNNTDISDMMVSAGISCPFVCAFACARVLSVALRHGLDVLPCLSAAAVDADAVNIPANPDVPDDIATEVAAAGAEYDAEQAFMQANANTPDP